jgi:hypothetical protein
MNTNYRSLLLAGAIAIGLLASVASGETNTATKVGGDSAKSGAATKGGDSSSDSGTAAPQAFAVGDQVKLGDYVLVVNTVTDPFVSGNEFDTPDEGKRYVAVDVSVTNEGAKPETVSSMMCFDLLDTTGQKYTMALVAGAPAAPDGEVDPGQPLRGTLTYEIPQTVPSADLSLKFKCDLLSSGSATVKLG